MGNMSCLKGDIMTGSLQEKRNIYYIVLNFYVNGKRKQKWISTNLPVKGNKTKATELLKTTVKEYEKEEMFFSPQTHLQDDGIRLCDYLTSWIADIEPFLGKCTYRTYNGYLNNHIIPYFLKQKLTINELKAFHLTDYYRMKMKEGKISAQTIKHHHRIMSKALRDAVRKEIIMINPAQNAEVPKVHKFVGTFLNPEQCIKLQKEVANTILELPISILVNYGLRRSELCGLCWKYVDLVNDKFTVANVLIQHPGGDYLKPYTKNASSYRTLPITPSIKKLLLMQKEKQQKNKILCGKDYCENDYVLTWDDGTVISPNYITRTFHHKIQETDLPPVRVHDLRHSAASNLLSMGFSIKEVQEWLGHSLPSTTLNFYSHIDTSSKSNIADRLEKLYST